MKLKETYETETYISAEGYYCIKQSYGSDGDTISIILSPDQMRLIAQEMSHIHQQCFDKWLSTDEGNSADAGVA